MNTDLVAIESISAVTLYTTDMARALRFYEALGMVRCYGDGNASFVSLRAGSGYVNLALGQPPERPWGRAILYVNDVDAMYARVLAAGYTTMTHPTDAAWGERYFHVRDPDENELSFARPLVSVAAP
jgi:catechol 2,3-dioxygenase-like lactoylglutathione lyase family enzyme